MAGHDKDISEYPVYTGAQRVLRFVSLLYLGWYVLSLVGGLALLAARFLFNLDIGFTIGVIPGDRGAVVAAVIFYALDIAFNLCFALSAWMCSNHPSIAKRFRIFAAVVLALTLISFAYSVTTGQAASMFSNLYSIVIVCFLLYLANQITHEMRDGAAVDFQDLAITPRGKHLRTESQLKRAIENGEELICRPRPAA